MHVIIYALDALRADHLGCYGYERPTSPVIDALARDGIVFENCFTATTWTRPVAASLLTGVYPGVHRTRSRGEMFSADIPRLPELLQKAANFKTAAFITMGNIAGEIGFNRGFDQYHDLFRDPAILLKRRRLDAVAAAMLHARDEEMALPRAEDINAPLFDWLEAHPQANTFSFIWSIEPHVPYDPPPGYRRFASPERLRPNEGEQDDIRTAGAADRQRLMDLYDDEIAYNDACIGRIVDYLKTHALYDETLFIILGDHGEAFYEHDVYSHGHAPFDEVIHVPLILKLPGQAHAGARVAALAELIDVMPTVLAGVGHAPATLTPAPFCQGHNLLPLVEGQTAVREFVFSDTQALEVHNRYLSIRDTRWKYIQLQRPPRDRGTLLTTARHVVERRLLWKILRSPRHFWRNYFRAANEYLFDLSRDPQEQNNLIAANPAQADVLRQRLAEWVARNELLASNLGAAPQDMAENALLAQHLERLGYL